MATVVTSNTGVVQAVPQAVAFQSNPRGMNVSAVRGLGKGNMSSLQ